RADVMLDLLNGISINGVGPSRSKGVVDIRVDLTTLAGLNDNPAELGGYGPVIADIARRVAEEQPDATWQYVVTDPETGRPLITGVTRRRPTASMARWVRALRPRCVFPGCRMPARQSDLDHRLEYAKGGRTAKYNLAPLCRYDHGIRHLAGWKYTIEPDGSITWRSRLGHTYRTGTDPP
ncbi:MAG: HNH endonuclease, partial [Acidimicrobiia bacterium]|nr:HNH endonuclease [Acidimicrobiia bacterium]